MPRGVKGSGKAKSKKLKSAPGGIDTVTGEDKVDGRKGKRKRRGNGVIIRKIAELFGQLPADKRGEVLSAMVTLHVE